MGDALIINIAEVKLFRFIVVRKTPEFAANIKYCGQIPWLICTCLFQKFISAVV